MNVIIAEPTQGKVYARYLDRNRFTLNDLLGNAYHDEAPDELRQRGIALVVNSNAMYEGESPNDNLYPFFYLGIVVFCGVDDDGEYIGLTTEQHSFLVGWIANLCEE